MKQQALVIGAGITGLASAALLARRGFEVTVVEKNRTTGGRIGEITDDGFRFETGPSWYLMPDAYEQFFQLMGTTVAEQLELRTLDPAYRMYTGPKEYLDIPFGADKITALFESIEPGAGAKLSHYLESAHLVYTIALDRFLYTTFASPRPFMTTTVLGKAWSLVRFLCEPLERFVDKQFRDHRLRKILQYPAVFLSTQPRTAPSMYHLMSHTDLQLGVQYPAGGFRAIVDAIESLAREHGVRIEFGAEATKLHSSGGAGRAARITTVSVATDDGTKVYHPDVVVSTADLHHTETALVPREYQSYPETYFAKKDPGIGTVLVMLGVRGKLPQLAHHTLLLSRHWQKDFDSVFSASGALAADKMSSSIYLCTPSATDDTVAPAACENLFVLVPTAADVGIGHGTGYPTHTTDSLESLHSVENGDSVENLENVEGFAGDRVGRHCQQESPAVTAIVDKALDRIAEYTGINDLSERIIVRHTLGPADFAADFHAWRGGALGPAHTLVQSAMFRPQNRSAKLTNLYYAGATVTPGVGVPICLISAENVLKRIDGRTDSRPMRADEVLNGNSGLA